MVNVSLIETKDDYEAALERVENLMDAQEGTAEAEELEILSLLIETYENKHYAIDLPDPIAAIKFRVEQENLANKDLIPYIGSSAKVSEVLSGKRDLTLSMIRALHKHLGIPSEVLIQEPGGTIPEDNEGIDWSRFPIAEMAKRNFFKLSGTKAVKDNAEQLMRNLMEHSGGFDVRPLFRKNDGARRNAKMDSYALRAWCTYVLAQAQDVKLAHSYQAGIVTLDFLRQVAQLSASENGPKLAEEFLAEHGIILVIAPHLPNTYLDGAALLLQSGTPVVGMTLRYDRIDNFWFCLLHELAHIGRHMKADNCFFIDDLKLEANDDQTEQEADEWAQEALIPRQDWNDHHAQDAPTVGNVIALAQRVGVHPAIVAGRIQRHYGKYRMLSQLVGHGEVRKHFNQQYWK